MQNNKKVIVFGGSGFLGGFVAHELKNKGYDVTIADILQTKYQTDYNFVKCDILNYDEMINNLSKDYDIIYNFAAFSNLDKASTNPVPTINLNIIGNLNILEYARLINCKHYVFASSAYATSNKGSFYGISKLSSEKIVEEYKRIYDLHYTIIRYGSVYSDRCYENNYLYNLIKTAIKTGKIKHEGDSDEIREYIHAADAATLSVDIVEDKKYLNQNIVLTGVERMRRKDLFDMINEILGGILDIEIIEGDYKDHYRITPYSFQPTASKKLVNNPYIDIGQGILECIKDIKKELETN